MNSKPVAIILGGIRPHAELIKKLKKRGYYTILIDYLDNSPAKAVADEHIQESTLDKEKVAEISLARHASLVITTNIDQANVTACYVAEKIGLKPPYSYETALNVTDKVRMKKIMWDNNIPTSKYVIASDCETVIGKVNYPAVVKPADCNGSKGVHRVDNDAELAHHFSIAKDFSRTGDVIVEDFVEGDEVSYYYYVQNGKPYYVDSSKKYKFKAINDDVMQSVGAIYPADVSEKAYAEMDRIAAMIVKAFGLSTTPLFIQAIIKGDEAKVLEFAPRLGGGLSFRVMYKDCGFDILEAAIDSFLGIERKIQISGHKLFAAVLSTYAPGITLGKIEGVEDIIKNNMATEFYQYSPIGASLSNDMSSKSRPGAFLIHAETREKLKEKILYINDHMEVYDTNGNPSMRHDIFDVWRNNC